MATAPTTALDDTDEHSTTALYRAAIGDISNGYYLPRFTRFEAADRPGLSWNWAAALNTLNWLMFRQLWHAALVYSGSIVALALLLFGIGKLVFQFSEGTQWGLLAAIGGLAFVVPGLGAMPCTTWRPGSGSKTRSPKTRLCPMPAPNSARKPARAKG